MEKILPVPYKSQWDNDARGTYNDCGPTSIAMRLNYEGQTLTTDDVFKKTGAGSGLITIAQMQKAIAALGWESTFVTNQTSDDIKRYINENNPVIALVHYGSLKSVQDKKFKGGHFFLVVGYRDDCYFVNDPNFQAPIRGDGDHHSYLKAEFEKAWKDCSLDENPINSLLVIKRKTVVKPTIEVFTDQFEEYKRSAEGFYRLCDILGKPRNVDVMVSEVNQLLDVEGKLQQSDKDLASFKTQLSDITVQLNDKTNELNQLKLDNQNLQNKVTEQLRTITELDGSIESAVKQIDELQKQVEKPISSYSALELILRGISKLFGK